MICFYTQPPKSTWLTSLRSTIFPGGVHAFPTCSSWLWPPRLWGFTLGAMHAISWKRRSCPGMNVGTLCPRLGMVGGVSMAPLSSQKLVTTLVELFNRNSQKSNKCFCLLDWKLGWSMSLWDHQPLDLMSDSDYIVFVYHLLDITFSDNNEQIYMFWLVAGRWTLLLIWRPCTPTLSGVMYGRMLRLVVLFATCVAPSCWWSQQIGGPCYRLNCKAWSGLEECPEFNLSFPGCFSSPLRHKIFPCFAGLLEICRWEVPEWWHLRKQPHVVILGYFLEMYPQAIHYKNFFFRNALFVVWG